MKFFKAILILSLLIFLQCAIIPQKGDLYSDQERSSLEKTLNILEYGFGYDNEMQLSYIYTYSYSNANIDKKEKEFSNYINSADINTLVPLYDKIVRVRAMTEYKMNRYKELREWRYYTFIKKELYTPLDKYSQLLKKNILKKNPLLETGLSEKESLLQREAVRSYVKDEDIVDTF
ncbi:MAG: hypothetical protein MUC95_04795 [Spirochaetes bacterium]|nr:hypothetical protein [Spirochaetota bacterium]